MSLYFEVLKSERMILLRLPWLGGGGCSAEVRRRAGREGGAIFEAVPFRLDLESTRRETEAEVGRNGRDLLCWPTVVYSIKLVLSTTVFSGTEVVQH